MLHWLWLDHFPSELGLTRAHKRAAKMRASAHRKREPSYRGAHRKYLLYFLPVFVVGMCGYAFWLDQLIRSRRLTGASPIMVSVVLMLVTYAAIAYGLQRARTPFIRRALRDMGYDICEDCGYWLRDLRDDVPSCPECEAQRETLKKMGLHS